MGNASQNAEIAFFGGSFTAVERSYMLELLKAAQPFLPRFQGIRISTRPDAIDAEILSVLKFYGVTSIELGAQSMDDRVLLANKRGHTVRQVKEAASLIRSGGFSLGLQMMTGLYQASAESDYQTARQFAEMKPDTVRIYPTVVMKGTLLETYCCSGLYRPCGMEESIRLCSRLLLFFHQNNIRVIRLGLHYSDSLAENAVFGNYHPAFKELCENEIFLERIRQALKTDSCCENIEIYVHPRSVSKCAGQHKKNIKHLNHMGYHVKIKTDDTLDIYEVKIKQA